MKNVTITILMLIAIAGALTVFTPTIEYCSGTLNRFRSYEELKDFLQFCEHTWEHIWGPGHLLPLEKMDEGNIKAFRELYGLDRTEEYSRTNVQVEGVDEADFVKTDGKYIYVFSDQTLTIVKAYPPEEANVLSRTVMKGSLKQLFINGEKLVVFCQNNSQQGTETYINIYNVRDRENPTLERQIIIDGCYYASRMIGEYIYVITRKPAAIIEGEVNLPEICSNGRCRTVPATNIYYSSVSTSPNVFTTVVAVNLYEDEEEPVDETVLSGWTTNLYVSLNNIYLAIEYGGRTFVHRIYLEDGEITYAADGEVRGRVLNQFSMDEYNGYFRIATTTGHVARIREQATSRNHLYVLDMDLNVIGKLEDLAPGEKIYSARFMENFCYLVTFRKVDPFFVIDLSDAFNPKVLGELKITGYSDYLHLYDDNHVIGVGKETIAAEEGEFSWHQGVKISLFDVTDMSKPEEIAKYEIGDRGTSSPVLHDHKAFLFDRAKNLLVIPVSVTEVDESRYPDGVPPYAYGELVWQGAYVFTISLDLEEPITLKGTITHIEDGDVYNISYHITRAFYIGEILYTVSENKIKMNALSDLNEIGEVNLKE